MIIYYTGPHELCRTLITDFPCCVLTFWRLSCAPLCLSSLNHHPSAPAAGAC